LVERITVGGWTVQSGLFGGMKYVTEARSSALLPKLLGTYEAEIAHEIERAANNGYRVIVDIGCAEGYYAVGMALRSPESEVWAYDTELLSRTFCGRMAALNGVADRVKVLGAFTPGALSSMPKAERFYAICDVEGFEAELFERSTVKVWQDADLVIELHDVLGHPCREPVLAAFAESHEVQLVDSRRRDPAGAELPPDLNEDDRRLCVDELRPSQQWAILRSRRHLHCE
jgi:hypothetical protein